MIKLRRSRFLILAILLASCSSLQTVQETWLSPAPIRVRVTRAQGRPAWLDSTDYWHFDSIDSAGRATRIFTVSTSDSGTDTFMPREQNVISISATIAYVYFGNMFGLTTDAGATWSTFDTNNFFNCGYPLCAPIQAASVASDGNGSMSASVWENRTRVDHEFVTDDYGRTWHRASGA